MKFRRVPIRVRAQRLDAPWEWQTSHGERMLANPGDFRVTDPSTGGEWSVTSQALGSGYAAIGNDEYESRGTVTARRVKETEGSVLVRSLEGPETALPGDWIVEDHDGNAWVVADWFFAQRYKRIGDE